MKVTDNEIYYRCDEMVLPTIQHFGRLFLFRGGQEVSYEGVPPDDRTAVIRFSSHEIATNLYHSKLYAEAKSLRMLASTSVQMIVEDVS
jgi:uncharacterized protein (DUF1330 family)